MRASSMIALAVAAAALPACAEDDEAREQNVAVDINSVDPSDIEALPPDESSTTPSEELVNGAAEPQVNDLNAATSNY